MKGEVINLGTKRIYSLSKPYSKGPYNKSNKEEQHIRISEGCPNRCLYCAETWENGTKPIYYKIPRIIRNRVVLLDMNLMYKPKCIKIIEELGSKKVNDKPVDYELQCGIDWRWMDRRKAVTLKQNRFKNIRWAWDYSYSDAYKHLDCLNHLIKAGYNPKLIQVFMICNWKIPYYECVVKLRTLAHWGVQVSNCWFDNQTTNVKPIYWTKEEIKNFKILCRDHNIRIRHNGMQTEFFKKNKRRVVA